MIFYLVLFQLIFSFVHSQSEVFDNLKANFLQSDLLCDAQLKYVDENFAQGALWARIMQDSWGRLPSGIFSGNLYDFGNYDQCIHLTHFSEAHGVIHGQHCTIVFQHDIITVDKRARFAPAPYE